MSKSTVRIALCLFPLLWWTSPVFGDAKLDYLGPGDYKISCGLDQGICEGAYEISPASTDPDMCKDTGEVGVSRRETDDKEINFRGTIQANADDGRAEWDVAAAKYTDVDTPYCMRRSQVYNITDRSQDPIPGMTNYWISLKIGTQEYTDTTGAKSVNICALRDLTPDSQNCQWSTQFAGPAATVANPNPETDQDLEIDFPMVAHQRMRVKSGPSGQNLTTEFWIIVDDGSDPVNDVPAEQIKDAIHVRQIVYTRPGKPYFDVTWELWCQGKGGAQYRNASFWVAADTFTAGNDSGYGYLCDITKLVGATGGTAFFQGMIALNGDQDEVRMEENWWASVFDHIRDQALPDFDRFRPITYSNRGTYSEALTTSMDNAMAVEWNNLTITTTPIYLAARWTFDDPIQNSSFGTNRSLFTVTSDHGTFIYDDGSADGVETKAEPMFFDAYQEPDDWRGLVRAYRLPLGCLNDGDCLVNGRKTETCQDLPGCTSSPSDEVGCDKLCYVQSCDGSEREIRACGTNGSCVFGLCLEDAERWMTGKGDSLSTATLAGRKIYTAEVEISDPDDLSSVTSVTWKEVSDVDFENDLGVDPNIMDWLYGTENSSERVEDANVDDPNMTLTFNPNQDPDDYDLGQNLRDRYEDVPSIVGSGKANWVLGDITHAEPKFVGATPQNAWIDPSTASSSYSTYTNSPAYLVRQPALFVAANDGMLHCFDATTGIEMWAFIPWEILKNVEEIASPKFKRIRTPTMNLTPFVVDAYGTAPGTMTASWHTILVVGTRSPLAQEGESGYYALRIDPTGNMQFNPSLMWRYAPSDGSLGVTYSEPTCARVDTGGGDGSWLLFFGSGYAHTSSKQMTKTAYLFGIDLFELDSAGIITPKEHIKFEIKASNVSGIAGVSESGTSGVVPGNRLGDPIGYDSDKNGFVDIIYAGDLAGHLMRFPLTSVAGVATVTNASVLFKTFGCEGGSAACTASTKTMNDFKHFVFNERGSGANQAADDQKYYTYRYPRPIVTKPTVYLSSCAKEEEWPIHKDTNCGYPIVLFGTGKFDTFYDSFDDYRWMDKDGVLGTTPNYQAIYGILDKGGAEVNYNEMFGYTVVHEKVNENDKPGFTRIARKVSMVSGTYASGGQGWVVWLDDWGIGGSGGYTGSSDATIDGKVVTVAERVITRGVVARQHNPADTSEYEDILFISTWTPNMEGTCDLRDYRQITPGDRTAGYDQNQDDGGGFVMGVRAVDGGNPSFAVQDVTGDNKAYGDTHTDGGWAGQRLTGSVLSRVIVANNALYVKAGGDRPPVRISIVGMPSFGGAETLFYRIKYR